MWKCYNCGGVVKALVEYKIDKEFNIGKDGKPTGKCCKKHVKEQDKISYLCSSCGRWSNSLNIAAKWIEE